MLLLFSSKTGLFRTFVLLQSNFHSQSDLPVYLFMKVYLSNVCTSVQASLLICTAAVQVFYANSPVDSGNKIFTPFAIPAVFPGATGICIPSAFWSNWYLCAICFLIRPVHLVLIPDSPECLVLWILNDRTYYGIHIKIIVNMMM